MTQTISQQRAAHALAAVTALQGSNDYGNFVSYVKALPATVVLSGLGQAMAMEKAGATKDKGHHELYRIVNDWLCEATPNKPRGIATKDLIELFTSCDQAAYISLQQEAMAYLEWLKKFAVAFLNDPTKDQNQDDEAEKGAEK